MIWQPFLSAVMPALARLAVATAQRVAGIHAFLRTNVSADVDGRDKPGHDDR
jgi:hypothetical protein